jgi:hypothetical protein
MKHRSKLALVAVVAACGRPFSVAEIELTPALETGDSTSTDAGASSSPDAAPPAPRRIADWVDVPTQHNDAARTGANLRETCVRPGNVSSMREERRYRVTGQIYAQPLVAGKLLIVATTANELAAFDLDSAKGTRRWSLGPDVLGTPANVVRNVNGPLGILSTPVVDVANDRLFVVARACPTKTSLLGCHHTLFSVRASTGALLDWVEVAPPGFDPDWQWNRPGLLLQNGFVYAGWGAGQSGNQHEEEVPYHGWIIAFRADDLHAPPFAHSMTEHQHGGGIWQAGGGLTGDGDSVFATTGNGIIGTEADSPLDFAAQPVDAENSAVRLRFTPDGGVDQKHYWDPRSYKADGNVFQYMERWDIDFSSAGPAFLPGTNDVVVGSKSGVVYLLDRETLAPLQPPLSAFTEPYLPTNESLYIYSYVNGPQILGAPIVWGDSVYIWPRYDRLARFHHDKTARTLVLETKGTEVASGAGGMMSLSANGDKDGLLWISMANSHEGYAASQIAAFDAVTLEKKWIAPAGGYAKFVCPTVSGGHVFVASWNADGSSDVIDYSVAKCD